MRVEEEHRDIGSRPRRHARTNLARATAILLCALATVCSSSGSDAVIERRCQIGGRDGAMTAVLPTITVHRQTPWRATLIRWLERCRITYAQHLEAARSFIEGRAPEWEPWNAYAEKDFRMERRTDWTSASSIAHPKVPR